MEEITLNILKISSFAQNTVTELTFCIHGSPITFSKFFKLMTVENYKNIVCEKLYNFIFDLKTNGIFFECIPVSFKTLKTTFRFVIITTNLFKNIQPNSQPFQSYFNGKSLTTSFLGKSGDVLLVVPQPMNNVSEITYTHLYNFIKYGSPEYFKNVFAECIKLLCETMQENKNTKYWLSTSGLGVSWLHFRIDTIPKYYNYEEYKN